MDDNSTEASDDDDRLFDNKEALRHDDAIKNFQWINTVPWTDIKDLRGTTYVQPPARLRLALQQAQHVTLRAIQHHGPSSSYSEPAWEVLLISSWQTGRERLLERCLDFFWTEDWPALWAMVRAECDVAPTAQGRTRSTTEQTEARICKVATLARAEERGRALAAVRNAPPVPVTRDIVQEITSLYPTNPDPTLPLTNQISHIYTFRIAEFIPLTLKRMQPSPLGMRAEH